MSAAKAQDAPAPAPNTVETITTRREVKPLTPEVELLPPTQPDEQPAEAEPNEDEIVSRFQPARGLASLKVSVFHLPNYERDFRTDTAAQREYLDTISVTDELENEIKFRWGALYRHFAMDFRRGGRITARGEFHIASDEYELEEETQQQAATNPPRTVVVGAPPGAAAALEQFQGMLATMAAMQKMFAQFNNPRPNVNPVDELIEWKRRLKELDELDGGRKTDAPVGSTVYDLARTALEQVPFWIESATQAITSTRASPPAIGAGALAAARAAGQQSNQQPPAGAQEQSGAQPVGKSTMEILKYLFEQLKAQAPVEDTARELLSFMVKNQQLAGYLAQFLNNSPQTVIRMISLYPQFREIKTIVHAGQWLGDLMAKIQELQAQSQK